jgi:CheY-like chemotaxis protein
LKSEKSSDNLIIVADSSPLICSVLKMSLEEAGFVIEVASNGN